MHNFARFGKTALITCALLLAALICLASFSGAGSERFGAYADGETTDVVITDDDYVADGKAVSVGLGIDLPALESPVSDISSGGNSAIASINISDSNTAVSFRLGGLLLEAAKSGRLRAYVFATGSVSFDAVSEGAASTAAAYSLQQTFVTSIGSSSWRNAFFNESGDTDRDPDDGIYDGDYSYSAVFTADNPLQVTSGYVDVSSDSDTISLVYTANFYISRTSFGVTATTVFANRAIDLDYFVAFDFREVSLTVSLNNDSYGKIVQGSYSELYDAYASALIAGENPAYDIFENEAVTPVASGSKITYGLKDEIAFTAIPAENSIFEYWSSSNDRFNTKTVNLGSAAGVSALAGDPEYTAHFRSFPVNAQTYVYNGSPQGPTVTDNTVTGSYTLKRLYYGTQNSGSKYYNEGLPTYAGSYTFAVAAIYGSDASGEIAGAAFRAFDIARRPVAISLETTEYDLIFGQTLSDLTVNAAVTGYDVGQSVAGTSSFRFVDSDGSISDETADADSVTVLGESDREYSFAYYFSPVNGSGTGTDAYNYDPDYVVFTVNVSRGFTVNGVGTEGGSFGFETSVVRDDATGAETINIILTAALTGDPAKWFFMGWRRGESTYLTAGETGYTYTYSVAVDASPENAHMEQLGYTFTAVFTGEGISSSIASLSYTGKESARISRQQISNSMKGAGTGYGTEIQNVRFGAAGGSPDDAVTVQPVAIGGYILYFDIYNALYDPDGMMQSYYIDTAEVPFEIIAGSLSVSVNQNGSLSYNYDMLTGWSNRMRYNLNPGIMLADDTQYYYFYKINAATEWRPGGVIGNVVANTLTYFDTPLIYGDTDISGKSAIVEYVFVAVNDTNGTVMYDESGEAPFGDLKVVATSAEVKAKLDNFTPVITKIEVPGRDTTQWASNYTFEITVTYGGSGLVFSRYKTGEAALAEELAYAYNESGYAYGADSGERTEPITTMFRVEIRSSFQGSLTFSVRGITQKKSSYEFANQVNIDADNPVIGIDSEAGGGDYHDGWYGSNVTLYVSVSDLGGSGLGELSVQDGLDEDDGISITQNESAPDSYIVVISEAREFVLIIEDGAGNVSSEILSYNVETEAPLAEYAPGSVVGGGWIGGEAVVEFVVTSLSGNFSAPAKLVFRTGDSQNWADATGYVDSVNGSVNLTYGGVIEGVDYVFKVVGANGRQSDEIVFGKVGFDSSAPVLIIETDLTPYLGSEWTMDRVSVQIRVTDVGNAGIPWKDPLYAVDGVYVADKPDTQIESADGNLFTVWVEDCTEYVVVARDRAGNSASVSFTIKVDQVVPDLVVEANVGDASGEEYVFGEWVTDGSAVVFTFSFGLTASGVRVQYSTRTNINWIDITSDMYPEQGSYTGTGTAQWPLEGERKTDYKFRVVTGSGRVFELVPETEDYFSVYQDCTAPEISEDFILGSDFEYPVSEKWTSQSVNWRFLPSDSVAGIDGVKVYRLPYYTAAEDIESLMVDENEIQLSVSGSYYICSLSEYALFVLAVTDAAGNVFRDEVLALIDSTSGFSASGTVTLNSPDGDALASGTPITEAADAAYFALQVDGIDSFGPSGARAEYSFDGVTWMTAEGYEEFTYGLTYALSLDFDGVYDLYVRVVTGAGEYASASFGDLNTFGYVKDTAELSVGMEAYYIGSDGERVPYSGEWTDSDVIVVVTVNAGASAGKLTIYYPYDPVREEEYDVVQNSVTYTVEVTVGANTRQEIKATYMSTRAGAQLVYKSIALKIDKTLPVTEVSATGEGGEISNGGYGYGQISVHAGVQSGISGIGKVEVSVNGGGWMQLQAEGGSGIYAYTWSEGATGDKQSLIFRTVSGAGAVFETEAFVVTRDETEAPTDAPDVDGRLSPDGWYLDIDYDGDGENDGLSIGKTFASLPISGLRLEYSYKVNGVTVEDYVSADESGRIYLVLHDLTLGTGEKGGTVYEEFIYAWVTGAGKKVAIGGDETEVYKIDGNTYYVSLDVGVANLIETVSSDSYTGAFVASVSGFGAYHRGETAEYSFSAAAGYRFRSYGTGSYSESYDPDDAAALSAKSGSYLVAGDFAVSVTMYKEVTYSFMNLTQYIQRTGAVTDVVARYPQEISDMFGSAFSPVLSEPEIHADAPFGVYEVTASFGGEYADYFVFAEKNGSVTEVFEEVGAMLRVTYFAGSGTAADPYLVYDAEDFSMITAYMLTYDDSAEETRYDLAFGQNRKKAYFKQADDIKIDNTFVAVSPFSGTYDGANRLFEADRLLVRSGGFSLFGTVNGAGIMNLGVRIRTLTLSDASGCDVAFVAADAAESDIRNVYVYGNVYVTGADDIVIGGVVARMSRTLVYASYSGVNVFADSVTGYIGLIVGHMTDTAYTSSCYSIGTITADNCVPFSASGSGDYLYAGTVAGYADNVGDIGPGEGNNTYYINGAVSYGGANIALRSLGNFEFADYEILRHAAVDDILGFLDMSANKVAGKTVPELVAETSSFFAAAYGVQGNGTPAQPFLISEADDLRIIAEVPWAYCLQTAMLVPGEYAEWLSKTPFRGYYDGSGYALSEISLKGEGTYLGLFRILEGTVKNLKLLNIEADFVLAEGGYAGLIAAVAEDGSEIGNVVVTGRMDLTSASGTVYAGAIGGVIAGTATDVITNASVFLDVFDGVTGSVFGQIRNSASVRFVTAIGSLNVEYSGRINVGAFAGENAAEASGAVSDSVYLMGHAYAGAYAVERAFRGSGTVTGETSYQSIAASAAYDSSGRLIGDIITGLHPFEGSGTQEDPFVIDSFVQLESVSSYMYASFRLDADITVGDFDGDGRADSADYVFESIGGNEAFTGTFNGNNHRILGLTAPLFNTVSGTVRQIGLALECVIDGYDDVTFGAVAEELNAGAQLVQVNVSGSVEITARGGAAVTAGGIAGVVNGGRIRVGTVGIVFKIRGANVSFGGIAGELNEINVSDVETWTLDAVCSADIAGATVNAGYYAGVNRIPEAAEQNYKSVTSTFVVNGVESFADIGKNISR